MFEYFSEPASIYPETLEAIFELHVRRTKHREEEMKKTELVEMLKRKDQSSLFLLKEVAISSIKDRPYWWQGPWKRSDIN